MHGIFLTDFDNLYEELNKLYEADSTVQRQSTRMAPSALATRLAQQIIAHCPDKTTLIEADLNRQDLNSTENINLDLTAFPVQETDFITESTWVALDGKNGGNATGIYVIKYIDAYGQHPKYKDSLYVGKATAFSRRSSAHFSGKDNKTESKTSMLHELIKSIRKENDKPDQAVKDNFKWRRLLTLTTNQKKFLVDAAIQNAAELNKDMLLSALEIAAISKYDTFIGAQPAGKKVGLNTTPGGDGGGAVTPARLQLMDLAKQELEQAKADMKNKPADYTNSEYCLSAMAQRVLDNFKKQNPEQVLARGYTLDNIKAILYDVNNGYISKEQLNRNGNVHSDEVRQKNNQQKQKSVYILYYDGEIKLVVEDNTKAGEFIPKRYESAAEAKIDLSINMLGHSTRSRKWSIQDKVPDSPNLDSSAWAYNCALLSTQANVQSFLNRSDPKVILYSDFESALKNNKKKHAT